MRPRRTPSTYASRFVRFRLNKSGKDAKIKNQLASRKTLAISRRENALLNYSLFCCTLLAAAHGVNAANVIARITPSQSDANRSSESKSRSFTKAICTGTSFYPVNKPLRIRLDKNTNGADAMAACTTRLVHGGPKECRRQKTIASNWNNDYRLLANNTLLGAQRSNADSNFRFEYGRLSTECNMIAASLTNQAADIFYRYCVLLRQIEYYNQLANQANTNNIGNCDEHSANNFMKLFRYSVENHHPIKLQIVEFASSRPGHGHVFLLVNSDARDIAIYGNEGQVTKYLKKIKKGQICDSWNAGAFIDFAHNTNEYYRSGWRSIKVTTYSTEFDLQKLPDNAANFMRRELVRLEVDLNLGVNANPHEDVIEDERAAVRMNH